MKVVVCGDRNWNNYSVIYDVLSKLDRDAIIIHGGASGADSIAGDIAAKLGFKVVRVVADWGKYGISAGPIRNRKMLDMNPNLVLAFHNNIENSKGTKDCVEEAKKRGIDIQIISKIK